MAQECKRCPADRHDLGTRLMALRRRPTIDASFAARTTRSRHRPPMAPGACPGACAGHLRLCNANKGKAWMAGTRPAMTREPISVPPANSFIVGRRRSVRPGTSPPSDRAANSGVLAGEVRPLTSFLVASGEVVGGRPSPAMTRNLRYASSRFVRSRTVPNGVKSGTVFNLRYVRPAVQFGQVKALKRDPITAVLYPAKATTASSNTCAPQASCSGVEYSRGLWVIPPTLGTNSIALGQSGATSTNHARPPRSCRVSQAGARPALSRSTAPNAASNAIGPNVV